MTKKSKQQRRKNNRKKQRKRQPKILQWLSRFWKLFVGISIVLGIIVAFLSLSPSITVSPTMSLNPFNPFDTPFQITNESLLPIHFVEITCAINIVESVDHVEIKNIETRSGVPPIPIMERKESKTFLCPNVIEWRSPIKHADINITVYYRPDFLLWRKLHKSRFVTIKDATGVLRWHHKPLSEK